MKINGFAILTLLSLTTGGVARLGNRFRAYGDDNPLEQRSRVTAFVNTENGLRVECWEIGDLLPENGSGARQLSLAGKMRVNIYTFPPSSRIYSSGVHTNGIDMRAKPNLFTVKDGIIFIQARPDERRDVAARDDDDEQYVFADVNGDDWFYFEDVTSGSSHEQCTKTTARSSLDVQTISGSDTTLINFEYESTPRHTVVHEGRCNFAGLKPMSPSGDAERFNFRSQELK
jgi:hypothetical protein